MRNEAYDGWVAAIKRFQRIPQPGLGMRLSPFAIEAPQAHREW